MQQRGYYYDDFRIPRQRLEFSDHFGVVVHKMVRYIHLVLDFHIIPAEIKNHDIGFKFYGLTQAQGYPVCGAPVLGNGCAAGAVVADVPSVSRDPL